MKLGQEASALKRKALASLRRAVRAFNDYEDDGRASTVLLHFQHAFEMLLKAGLVQSKQQVMDRKDGRAIGFEKCVNLGREHLKITDDEAGTLRAIDALRDDEQHWLTKVSEGILYQHCRAGTTLFDDLLMRIFGESLGDYIPHRVLPISSEPPRDIQLVLDDDFTQIAQLLAPGKRKRTEARSRIRALLALEAHVREDGIVSKKDVDRVERAVRSGGTRQQVFPQLSEIASVLSGDGIEIKVRFVKGSGVPVRFVPTGDDVAAGAVREVDLQKKYHLSKTELSTLLNLNSARCKALRWMMGIDDDENCRHNFTFGSQTYCQYSDNAVSKMREALESDTDIEDIYRRYIASGRGKSPYSQVIDTE